MTHETEREILMVRPARLELTTLCLEGRCSIQLSYGRTLSSGRGGEIRTRDILLPKQARYRAALRHEESALYESNAEGSKFPSNLECRPLKSLLSFSSPQEEAVS